MTMLNAIVFIAMWLCLQRSAASKAVVIKETFVYPRILEQRSDQDCYTLHINEQITVNLKKASPFSKNLKIIYEDGDKNSLKQRTLKTMSGDVYKDSMNHTAVMISFRKGLRIKGIIKGKFVIDHVEHAEHQIGLAPHILTPITSNENNTLDREDAVTAPTILRSLGGFLQERQLAENLQNAEKGGPQVVTVKVGLVVSQQYVVEFKKSNYSEVTEVIDYLALFICFVNIFLEKLDKEVLDLKLRVFQIAFLKKTTESFLEYEINEKVITGNSLGKLNDFVHSNSAVFAKTNVVFYISLYPIATANADGRTTVYASGYATVGGACSRNRSAIIQDKPKTYDGVLTAVHELFHLLGCVHDGQNAPRHLPKSPGAVFCSSEAPTVMAPDMVSNRPLRISNCTRDQVLFFIMSPLGRCLRANITRQRRKIIESKIKTALLNTETFCYRIVPAGKNITFSPQVEKNGLKNCLLGCTWIDKNYVYNEFQVAPDYTPCEFAEDKVTKICLQTICTQLPAELYAFPKNVKSNL